MIAIIKCYGQQYNSLNFIQPFCAMYQFHLKQSSPRLRFFYHHIWYSVQCSQVWKTHSFSSSLCGQVAQYLSHLTIKPVSKRHLPCPCDQLEISVALEGADFLIFFGRHPLSSWQCKIHFTVDSNAGVSEVSSSWYNWDLVVPMLFLSSLSNLLSSESDNLLFSRVWKSGDISK